MRPYSRPVAPSAGRALHLLKAGWPEEAIAPLREAAALRPDDSAIQHDLGLACLEAGRLSEAIEALQCATSSNPRFADAWFRLGIAHEKSGNSNAAIAAYHQATTLLPSLVEAWFRAGALVATLGHREEAILCFKRAASAGPKTGFGRLGAARALLAEARYEEAERALRRLLALKPGHPMALDLLGNLLAEQGRFEEAEACFGRAIAQAPLMAGSYYDLVRCRRMTESDRDLLGRIAAALATPGIEPTHRQRLHLARGKVAEDLGEYALAMASFDAADAERRSVRAFNAATFDREVSRLIERFTQAQLARAQAREAGDPAPVLIVGMPRSGTTLVEQILSSHKAVSAGGELDFWTARGAASHQAGEAGTSEAFLVQAAVDYLAVLRRIGPEAARVTDKMPFNFLWAGLIHLACPAATIIHCRRSPIDTALSIHQTHFHPDFAFPTGGAELVAYIRSMRRLMAHWRRVLPRERFIEVEYETLTAAPEAESRRLVASCGLDWDESCLRPEANPRIVRTPSKWQARQSINREAVGRWRRYEPWLRALRPLLDEAP